MLVLSTVDSSLTRVSSSSSSDDKDPPNWKRAALIAGGTFLVTAGIILTYAGAKKCWPKVTNFTATTYRNIVGGMKSSPSEPPAPLTPEQIAAGRERNRKILNAADKFANSREMQAIEKMEGGNQLVLAMFVGLVAAAILLLPLFVAGLALSVAYTAPIVPGLALTGTGAYLISKGLETSPKKA